MQLVLLLTFAFAAISARADVVASIRYFKAEGVSHYHLFLFRDDGTLVRQLTSPEDAHDVGPKFIERGQAILFTRKQGKKEQTWRIGTDGIGLRKLSKAPAGFPVKADPPSYFAHETEEKLQPPWEPVPDGFRMAVPGSKVELLTTNKDESGNVRQVMGTFHHIVMHDTESGTKVDLAVDRGEEIWMCGWMTCQGTPFLQREGMSVAFFYQTFGSSDVYRVGAIDLLREKVVPISQHNPADFVPHGTRPGFFSICSEFYQDLPGTSLVVNCLYLDWWDKDFKRVRFSQKLSLFGGASIFVAGQPQLDIPYDAERSRGF
jgi:hypothetical protein